MDMAIKTDKTMTLSIDGMSCGGCVTAVTKALTAVPGVKVRSVAVGSAEIEAGDASAASKAITALEVAGYPARATTKMPDSATKLGGGCCGGASAAARPGDGKVGGCCG
jgi:copper chaperone CopZ